MSTIVREDRQVQTLRNTIIHKSYLHIGVFHRP